jgi:hypothetical protein
VSSDVEIIGALGRSLDTGVLLANAGGRSKDNLFTLLVEADPAFVLFRNGALIGAFTTEGGAVRAGAETLAVSNASND